MLKQSRTSHVQAEGEEGGEGAAEGGKAKRGKAAKERKAKAAAAGGCVRETAACNKQTKC